MPIILQYGSVTGQLSIAERIARGMLETCIIVVPTKRRTRHLTREILQSRTSVTNLNLFTLSGFAGQVHSRVAPDVKVLGNSGRVLLFQSAVRHREPSLEFFSGSNLTRQMHRGTFEKLVNLIVRLKETGVYPEELELEIEHADLDEKRKLGDVLAIYRSYEEFLAGAHATDEAGIFATLAFGVTRQQFDVAFREKFSGVDLIALVGFDEFTLPETEFIHKLTMISGMAVTLIFDYHPGNPALFGHLEENFSRFNDFGFRHNKDAGARALIGPLFSRPISDPCTRLFNHEQNAPPSVPDTVTLFSARDRHREVDLVCKLVKDLAMTKPGRDLSRICVAMHRTDLYTEKFREAFQRFGIPANITDRFRLSHSPPVIALLGALQVQARGYLRDDILRVAGSPYLHWSDSVALTDVSDLITVSARLRLLRGAEIWITRLKEELHTEKEGNPRSATAGIADETRSVESALRLMTAIRQRLQPFSVKLTPRQFMESLECFVREARMFQRILQGRFSGAITEKDVRGLTVFLELCREVVEVVAGQEGPENEHTLQFYLEKCTVAAALERYNIREEFGNGVLVTSIEETRGLPLEVMIVVGLVEGEFPTVYRPEIFYSQSRQKKRARRHELEQRYLFYQAVSNREEQLYLTYPETDGEVELVRSSFLDEISLTLNVVQKSANIFDRRISSADELLAEVGRAIGEQRGVGVDIPPIIEEQAGFVKHAIAVERSRSRLHDLPHFEGMIGGHLPGDSRERLEALRNRTYSVGQLESYAKCPFQFFAGRLLHVRAPGELEDTVSPAEKGSMMHQILYEFFTRRREAGLPGIRECTEGEYYHAIEQLTTIAREYLESVNVTDPFWRFEVEGILGGVDGGGVLREFLESERSRADAMKPEYFEVSFGSGASWRKSGEAKLGSEKPVVMGQLKLRGQVDRVDVEGNTFSVIDYKTGKIPVAEEIRQGISLQLPLYLEAIRQLLDNQFGKSFTPSAGMYYHLRHPVSLKPSVINGRFRDKVIPDAKTSRNVLSGEEFDSLLHDSIEKATGFVRGAVRGDFPLTTPERIEKVCAYCPFKICCRIQEFHHVVSTGEDS